MIGITGWGCYIPWYRLSGATLKAAWGGSAKGSCSLANHDEDPVTMAAEAALECLTGHDPLEVDRLFFASASAPYQEHLNAAIVAAVADLRDDIQTSDYSGTTRAATSALRAAYNAVGADDATQVMVAASDMRMARPGDPLERELGDGACALMVGRGEPVAVFKGFYSTSKMFLDYWRTQSDTFIQSGEAKFIGDKGVSAHLPEVLGDLLESMDLAREEIAHVVYNSPTQRSRKGLNKVLGFSNETYLDQSPQASIGNTGNAAVMLELMAVLGRAKPGDKILMLNYGSGADAVLLEATDRISTFQCTLNEQIQRCKEIESYIKYLNFRKLLPQEQLNVWTALPVMWREEKPNIRLLAKKCKSCGAIQYPPRVICWSCKHDQFSTYKLKRKGKVYSFTRDHMPPNPDAPTCMVSVDLDGGGRFYTQATDVDSEKVQIGIDMELVFRKIHEGGGFNNYFWKFRPVGT